MREWRPQQTEVLLESHAKTLCTVPGGGLVSRRWPAPLANLRRWSSRDLPAGIPFLRGNRTRQQHVTSQVAIALIIIICISFRIVTLNYLEALVAADGVTSGHEDAEWQS